MRGVTPALSACRRPLHRRLAGEWKSLPRHRGDRPKLELTRAGKRPSALQRRRNIIPADPKAMPLRRRSLKQRRSQDLDGVFPALRGQGLGLLRGRWARRVGRPGARRRAAKSPNETLELPVGGNGEPARALAGFDPIGVRYLLRRAQRLAGACLDRAAADVGAKCSRTASLSPPSASQTLRVTSCSGTTGEPVRRKPHPPWDRIASDEPPPRHASACK